MEEPSAAAVGCSKYLSFRLIVTTASKKPSLTFCETMLEDTCGSTLALSKNRCSFSSTARLFFNRMLMDSESSCMDLCVNLLPVTVYSVENKPANAGSLTISILNLLESDVAFPPESEAMQLYNDTTIIYYNITQTIHANTPSHSFI